MAEFITERGSHTQKYLAQLWRRIIFNIAVSNSDDHLINHGFIYQSQGWSLSPAFDINPINTATGLHLNIMLWYSDFLSRYVPRSELETYRLMANITQPQQLANAKFRH